MEQQHQLLAETALRGILWDGCLFANNLIVVFPCIPLVFIRGSLGEADLGLGLVRNMTGEMAFTACAVLAL